jgi:hypothetical protein
LLCPAGDFRGGKTTPGSAPGDISVAFDQFPAPNDNSYGANAIGWPGGHLFKDLTNSDKAGFQILRPNNTVAVSFNVDYITATTGVPSGYASRGPFGGDGSILTNSSPPLTSDGTTIQWDTSFSRDLNGVQNPFGTYSSPTYFVGGAQTIGNPPGPHTANLLKDSPPVDCSLATDPPTCIINYGPPKGIQYPLAVPNPWIKSYDNPEYSNAGGPIPIGAFDAGHVDGWNFHDTYFVTFEATYLTAIGFDFNNYAIATYNSTTNTFTCPSGTWCIAPNPTALHNSPAKPCPTAAPSPTPTIPPTLVVTSKTVSAKNVKVDIKNNTGVNQVLTGLSITWPQGTNGNLNNIKFEGTTIYNTPTGGGSLTTSSLLGTTAQRTISPGATDTLQFSFANNASTNLNNYTGSATFNPFGPITILP